MWVPRRSTFSADRHRWARVRMRRTWSCVFDGSWVAEGNSGDIRPITCRAQPRPMQLLCRTLPLGIEGEMVLARGCPICLELFGTNRAAHKAGAAPDLMVAGRIRAVET